MREQAQIIRWEDPTPAVAGRRNSGQPGEATSRYTTIAADLRARRGRWAVVEEFAGRLDRGLSSKINKGAMVCFAPAGDFEAVTRRGEGVVRVYARYLGDGGDDA